MNRPERGSAAVEFIALTVVILVPLFYLLMAVFNTQRTSYAVTAASEAGARAFVGAPDSRSAEQRMRQAVDVTLADYAVADAQVTSQCAPQCFVAGSTVQVSVRARQRLPLIPDVFGETLASIDVSSTHTEPFGKYRASVP